MTARAHVQLGDLVTAGWLLERIEDEQVDTELKAMIAVDRAAIGDLTGDDDSARAEAETALAVGTAARSWLAARSVLGKLLRARGERVAADSHFAADSITGGEHVGKAFVLD